GRKHQLRKHLSCIGCPIIGDKRYGGKTKEFTLGNRAKDFKYNNDKLQLHARSIEFQHPFTGENIKVKADPPAHMDKKLQFFDTGNFE
ncbi:MAG: RNA pseudouridine synthase, partial [Rickettsiales bacterium]|nr:RNA pseudouridine synthase [Rickettsiales bacterium]